MMEVATVKAVENDFNTKKGPENGGKRWPEMRGKLLLQDRSTKLEFPPREKTRGDICENFTFFSFRLRKEE